MTFALRVDYELELRLPRAEDAERLFAVIDKNRAHLGQWLPWVDKIQTVEDEMNWIDKVTASFEAGELIPTVIHADGEPIGSVGTLAISEFDHNTEIGYWVAKGAQGRGIVTRACRALVGHLLGEGGLHRVQIRAGTENARSRAVAERLGFREEGVQREAGCIGGRFFDIVVYGMLAREWEGTRVD